MGKLIEAVRKLGNKLTGKQTVESNSLVKVINDIADDYEGGGGTSYEAGTGIDITDNTISIDTQTVAQKSELPNEVIANPTLAGTEDDLTGIEIGGIKYKVPQGGGSSQTLYTVFDIGTRLNGKVFNYTKFVSFLADLGFSTNYELNEYTIGNNNRICQIGPTFDNENITIEPFFNMNLESSSPNININLNSCLNIYNSTGYSAGVTLSQLTFMSNFDPITFGDDGYTCDFGDFHIFAQYIPNLICCIKEDVENEDFFFTTVQFDWEDFFACFDTPVGE